MMMITVMNIIMIIIAAILPCVFEVSLQIDQTQRYSAELRSMKLQQANSCTITSRYSIQ